MFKTIDEALDWIMAQRNENSTFEHFKQIMESIGNPQNQLISFNRLWLLESDLYDGFKKLYNSE